MVLQALLTAEHRYAKEEGMVQQCRCANLIAIALLSSTVCTAKAADPAAAPCPVLLPVAWVWRCA